MTNYKHCGCGNEISRQEVRCVGCQHQRDMDQNAGFVAMFGRFFQFIVFPLIGLAVATIAAVFSGALIVGKYAAAATFIYAVFR